MLDLDCVFFNSFSNVNSQSGWSKEEQGDDEAQNETPIHTSKIRCISGEVQEGCGRAGIHAQEIWWSFH